MKHSIFYFLLISLLISKNNIAQSDCKKNIKQAEDFYTAGEFDNCIQLTTSALKNCFYSKKEKEDAYQLLIKCYLETDNIQEADKYAKKLLNNNPNYELKENNNFEDYNRLIKKFSVHPLLSIGLRNTALRPNFKTTKVFSVLLDGVDYNAPYVTTKTLLMYYGWIEFEFIKNLSLNAEFTGLNMEYERRFNKSNWNLSYNEKLSFLEIPFYLKKNFLTTKTIFPYASFGLSYLGLTKATANAQLDYETQSSITGEKQSTTIFENNINIISQRSKSNFLGLVGAGIGFRFKNFGLFIDVRYYKGINNLTQTSNRFNNNVLLNDYFYIDNSVVLNKFEGGICISYTLKNSVKKIK